MLPGGRPCSWSGCSDGEDRQACCFAWEIPHDRFFFSNCVNSGIDRFGVLIQYKSSLLNRYLGTGAAWDLDAASGRVTSSRRTPHRRAANGMKGTADAIYHNIDFRRLRP